jgi:hypothetical protein
LARNRNRRQRRPGRRPHSRSFHPHPTTHLEPVLRHWPLYLPQGCRGHTGTGGRICPRQAAHSGNLSQCG